MKISKKTSLVAGAVVVAVTVGSFGIAEAAAPAKSSKVGASVATSKPVGGRVVGVVGAENKFKTILDGLVTKGTITQGQEDAIIAALAAARPVPGVDQPGVGGHDDGEMGRPNEANHAAEEAAILSTLGITAATLKADRDAGQSLATVAGAKTSALITALVAVENGQIDAEVTAGKLTAAQAITMKANTVARVTAQVNATPHQGGMGHGGHGGHGGPGAPAPTPVPTK